MEQGGCWEMMVLSGCLQKLSRRYLVMLVWRKDRISVEYMHVCMYIDRMREILVQNLNDARSNATRARLISSTIESLVDIGFTKTTGVEVCRRAQLTRGALNHHFSDFSALLVETLQTIYRQLLEIKLTLDVGSMERILLEGHARVIRPEFKAVIELWLASRNDIQFGQRLALAMELGSELFSPEMVLEDEKQDVDSKEFEMIFRTIFEALIGIGLGRAISDGEALAHESMVLQVLQDMAQTYDHLHQQST